MLVGKTDCAGAVCGRLKQREYLSYEMAKPETNGPSAAPGEGPVVRIEKLVHGGLGLSRVEGRVVLVGFVLPGETVRIRLARERSGFSEARLVEVLESAAGRVEPQCPYFGRCGGCRLQHGDYSLQLELKRDILVETLRRIGKIEPPETIAVLAGPPWGYRNRVQLHSDGRRLGYFETGSHRLCAVDQCPIASPMINRVLAALNEMLRDARFPRSLRTLEIFTNEDQVQMNVAASEGARVAARRFFEWCAERLPGVQAQPIDYPVAEHAYRVGPRSFFQVNRFLIEELLRCALESAAGEAALDLYAGVGLFSLPLARRFQRVAAVESSLAAARDLEFNAARAGLAIQVERCDAAEYLLADPPRSGLGRQVLAEILRLRPARVTIVSCDPPTLARDLGPLAAGGYRLRRLTLVDLFPQTHHLEAVAALEL